MRKKSNKKIRNATSTTSKGITFKSRLEKVIYLTLLEEGITPEYEPKTFILWDGFTPKTLFFDKETDAQHLERDPELKTPKILVPKMSKVIGIRYTPDFYFKYGDLDIWIEAKGVENDVFYIKKKLFRKFLDRRFEDEHKESIFFEVYTKKQLLQAIQIVKDYEASRNNNTTD